MRFWPRKRKSSTLEVVYARANWPALEPGAAIRYIDENAPPGLEEYSGVMWLGALGHIEYNEEWEQGFPGHVIVRFTREAFPMELQPGYEFIDLVCEPKYLEAL